MSGPGTRPASSCRPTCSAKSCSASNRCSPIPGSCTMTRVPTFRCCASWWRRRSRWRRSRTPGSGNSAPAWPTTRSRAPCAGWRCTGEPCWPTGWVPGGGAELIRGRGFNRELGVFTQQLDGKFADASNLLLPTLGLVAARDPRFVATVEAYERILGPHGLMRGHSNLDDFGPTTSSFSVCSFWHAEALALMGRLDDAVALFNRLLGYANPVGLFSEDIDPAPGALLGNFPQAYTHVGLVHAAMTIGELLEARDGRVRAWT